LRGAAGGLLALLVLFALTAPAAAAELEEPVGVTTDVPAAVVAGKAFPLSAAVKADPGALDIAAQPLRLRVRFAPECGGSFAGTEGPTALDRVLPAPTAGAPYEATVSVKTKLGSAGPEVACAFLEDAQERQFATDTEATFRVVRTCGAENLTRLLKRYHKLERRIAKARKRARRLPAAERRHAMKKLRTLGRKVRRVIRRLRRWRRLIRRLCSAGASASAAEPHLPPGVPRIRHLFVIVLENENAESTFGANPPAPYLGNTLREEGAFIPNYYGIGHESLDNYIAMVSGQPPNLQTQADCQIFTEMVPGTVREDGVALGQGCVFPRSVRTIANQLENSGQSWHGYMQDMANAVAEGEPASCRHPAIGAIDPTQQARAADQYAARHNPFVYFHSIIDYETCQRNDVDLGQLPHDLESETTTPAYSFITPDLCSDGHDATCANPALPGGFAGIDAFLREWVPQIKASPAYKDQGAIMITFDESASGAESCCGEPTGPNTPNNGGPDPGSGGGRVGAVMLSPCIAPHTETKAPYNHYSFLRWSEDDFGLAHLANAGAEGLKGFGTDVFTKPGCDPEVQQPDKRANAHVWLSLHPRRVIAGQRRRYRFRVISDVPACQARLWIRFGGRRIKTNGRGQARARLRLRGPGKHFARVRAPGCPPAKAAVFVKRG
jgi:phosphatidylinositol-3-phosphatase